MLKNKGELESLGINRVVDKLKRIAGINWGGHNGREIIQICKIQLNKAVDPL